MENVCVRCGRQFKYRRNLYKHERVHIGKCPYRCCGKGFSSLRGFKRHRCASHGEDKPFDCRNCGKTFPTKEDLTAHEKREERRQTFTCSVCDRQTATKADMDQHMRTHSDEQQDVCRTCGKRFKHRSSLYRHVKNKHT